MNPGDPFEVSAVAWNTLMDVAKAQTSFGGRPAGPVARQSVIIQVKNESGSDLNRNSIVGLVRPVFTPEDSTNAFLREVAFRAVKPDITLHKRRYAVLLDPAKDGRFARAYVSGICQVKVDVRDTSHEFAVIGNNNAANLVSSRHGHAQILWTEGDDGYGVFDGYGYGTGVQWAVVRLGVTMSSTAIGKANGDITPRVGSTFGTGRVDLYRASFDAYGTATADGPVETIDVLNSSAEEFGAYGTGIPDGMEVSVWWDADDVAWVAPLECSVH